VEGSGTEVASLSVNACEKNLSSVDQADEHVLVAVGVQNHSLSSVASVEVGVLLVVQQCITSPSRPWSFVSRLSNSCATKPLATRNCTCTARRTVVSRIRVSLSCDASPELLFPRFDARSNFIQLANHTMRVSARINTSVHQIWCLLNVGLMGYGYLVARLLSVV